MSIDVIGMSHSMKPRRSPRRIVFRDINMHIEEGQRVAILGKKGSGLEELMNIVCGAEYPARGHVVLSSAISWPIGEAGFLSSDATLATNLRFLARIHEVDEDEYADLVGKVGELQDHWNEKYGGCTKEVRARFAFALGVCLPFDIYLFESVELADKAYRETADEIVERLARDAGVVVTTARGDVARQFCDRGYVLDGGEVTYYEDIEEAVAHLERLQEVAVVEPTADYADDEREDDVLDII